MTSRGGSKEVNRKSTSSSRSSSSRSISAVTAASSHRQVAATADGVRGDVQGTDPALFRASSLSLPMPTHVAAASTRRNLGSQSVSSASFRTLTVKSVLSRADSQRLSHGTHAESFMSTAGGVNTVRGKLKPVSKDAIPVGLPEARAQGSEGASRVLKGSSSVDGGIRVRPLRSIVYPPTNIPDGEVSSQVPNKERVQLTAVVGARGGGPSHVSGMVTTAAAAWISPTEVAIPVAAVVVILDCVSGTQRHYVEHSDDITGICTMQDGSVVASAQVGRNACVRVWNSSTLETLAVAGPFMRFSRALAFVAPTHALVCSGGDDQHSMYAFSCRFKRINILLPSKQRLRVRACGRTKVWKVIAVAAEVEGVPPSCCNVRVKGHKGDGPPAATLSEWLGYGSVVKSDFRLIISTTTAKLSASQKISDSAKNESSGSLLQSKWMYVELTAMWSCFRQGCRGSCEPCRSCLRGLDCPCVVSCSTCPFCHNKRQYCIQSGDEFVGSLPAAPYNWSVAAPGVSSVDVTTLASFEIIEGSGKYPLPCMTVVTEDESDCFPLSQTIDWGRCSDWWGELPGGVRAGAADVTCASFGLNGELLTCGGPAPKFWTVEGNARSASIVGGKLGSGGPKGNCVCLLVVKQYETGFDAVGGHSCGALTLWAGGTVASSKHAHRNGVHALSHARESVQQTYQMLSGGGDGRVIVWNVSAHSGLSALQCICLYELASDGADSAISIRITCLSPKIVVDSGANEEQLQFLAVTGGGDVIEVQTRLEKAQARVLMRGYCSSILGITPVTLPSQEGSTSAVATVGSDRALRLWLPPVCTEDSSEWQGPILRACARLPLIKESKTGCKVQHDMSCVDALEDCYVAVGSTNGSVIIVDLDSLLLNCGSIEYTHRNGWIDVSSTWEMEPADEGGNIPYIYTIVERPSWLKTGSQVSTVRWAPPTHSLCTSGDALAVARRCGIICIYQVFSSSQVPQMVLQLSGHSCAALRLDWSKQGNLIRCDSSSCEVLTWDVGKAMTEVNEQNPHLLRNTGDFPSSMRGSSKDKQPLIIPASGSAQRLRDVSWYSNTVVVSWQTLSCWPEGSDGSDVNTCDVVPGDVPLLLTGDDHGLLKVYHYPCSARETVYREYVAHSSHVLCVRIIDSNCAVSAGGYDLSLAFWRINTQH